MLTEVDNLRRELEQVRQESLTDALTGVANRKAFDMKLDEEIRLACDDGEHLCLLLAEVDHFRRLPRWLPNKLDRR